jgi:hypothetical protein
MHHPKRGCYVLGETVMPNPWHHCAYTWSRHASMQSCCSFGGVSFSKIKTCDHKTWWFLVDAAANLPPVCIQGTTQPWLHPH